MKNTVEQILSKELDTNKIAPEGKWVAFVGIPNNTPKKEKIMHESWDAYFIRIAELVSMRSPCLSRHVGAVIVKDKNIIATGYNGPASGVEHCQICTRKCDGDYKSGFNYETCRAVHAEINAIVQAAKHGNAIKDSTMYCTFLPCSYCMKTIVNAGIKEIVVDRLTSYKEDFCQSLDYWKEYITIRGPR